MPLCSRLLDMCLILGIIFWCEHKWTKNNSIFKWKVLLFKFTKFHRNLACRQISTSINSKDNRLITTKFGNQMQNDMPMTMHTSKWKPEIECQFGGCPFFETRSSFISAVNWDISSKFGMRTDFHLLKQIPSLNLNPEVDFRLHGRRKSICGNNSAADRPITTKFGKQMQNDMPMTIRTWKSKPEIEFQYGGHRFS